ncbi:uncharacterized protein N7482_010153 [Penicillium canariense]|uniref:Uncharacterized protein n=1 Tax=Penicillium canariense TaxID=189055 RepID=A0A9W9HLY0_9EURO|nr:uncharacterized protein N7482_010153 [Penicillium canariense]KAJ5150901.1 hypothetical protein N7482_010153 [Penicillium canariense]
MITTDEEETYRARPDGPDEDEVSRQARQGLPLALPWGREIIRLGTTFFSDRQTTMNPWSDETPFVLSELHMIKKELHAEYGTNSTFKKVSTRKTCETGNHLSLGFGVGVGLPYLASVNVKGTYDEHLQENKDSDKISLTSSCRAGTIEFQSQPRLTLEAIKEIKYGGGFEGLCQRYGDYYLAGYRLGGDTGILMSASGQSRTEIEKYGITATVTVLLISASEHWEKEFQSFRSGRQVRLLGYDTLDNKHWQNFSAAGDDIKEVDAWACGGSAVDSNSLLADTNAIMTRSENILERVSEVLERHGYRNGESLTYVQCEELVQEGIVVELLLQPMSRLRDVILWRNERNII